MPVGLAIPLLHWPTMGAPSVFVPTLWACAIVAGDRLVPAAIQQLAHLRQQVAEACERQGETLLDYHAFQRRNSAAHAALRTARNTRRTLAHEYRARMREASVQVRAAEHTMKEAAQTLALRIRVTRAGADASVAALGLAIRDTGVNPGDGDAVAAVAAAAGVSCRYVRAVLLGTITRQPVDPDEMSAILARIDAGVPIRVVAKEFHVADNTIARELLRRRLFRALHAEEAEAIAEQPSQPVCPSRGAT